MRTSILAIIVAFGTTIVVPALAQQQPTPGQQEEDPQLRRVRICERTRKAGCF
jgi:hypothetical protein